MGEVVAMTEQEMKRRTKRFALSVMGLVGKLKRGTVEDAVGRQLAKSGPSVGANYRSACRGRSPADFVSRLAIEEEEADETCYWLELIVEGKLLPRDEVAPVLTEANELTAILTASVKTARKNATEAQSGRQRHDHKPRADAVAERPNPKSRIRNPESQSA